MSILPELHFAEDEETEELELETSVTYAIDFETGRITTSLIDGLEAIKQFVNLSLRTERYAYPVYDHDIGSELREILIDETASDAFKEMEIPRVIEEALVYDDRIDAVTNIDVQKRGDSFFISFTVECVEGIFDVQEVIGNGELGE